MDEDQDVIRRVLEGEMECFRVLMRRYERLLFSLIRSLIADEHDGEDIAQEVFLAAYRRLASFDPSQGAFSTWLLTIGRNKCLNALKKCRPLALNHLPETPESRPPDADMNEAEWFRRLDEALDALPLAQKTAFVLAEIQDRSLEEIGRMEGVPVGTVKSRLCRAKEKLRSKLRPTEQPDGRL